MLATSPAFRQLNKELGILICQQEEDPFFAESLYIRRLIKIGKRLGLPVFAFDPLTWQKHDDSVVGWSWNESLGWQTKKHRVPKVIYDRAFPKNQAEYIRYQKNLLRLREACKFFSLNSRLPNKENTYKLLAFDKKLASFLIPTIPYSGPNSLRKWLRLHQNKVFLKPNNGSKGKRVLAINSMETNGLKVLGRNQHNQPIRHFFSKETEGLETITRWVGSRAYVMQPYFNFTSPSGHPFDVRVLIQKDQTNRWSVTGTCIRIGPAKSVTANLHGGGCALAAQSTLQHFYKKEQGEKLVETLTFLSMKIANHLEKYCGRLGELGLDYGIDRQAKIWFLEANSKPGRDAMKALGPQAVASAAEKPLSYAKAILLRPPGGIIHEFGHL